MHAKSGSLESEALGCVPCTELFFRIREESGGVSCLPTSTQHEVPKIRASL